MKRGWMLRVAALVLALTVVGAVTVYATQGSSSDPLVTLSYLTDIFTPSVLQQVDAKVAERQTAYQAALDQSVETYTARMQELLRGGGGGGQTGAAYTVVDLARGQTLTGAVGCELLLRAGSATCVSGGTPGLIDSTGGGTLSNGGALVKNHLYLVTVEGRGIAADDAVKVLVRGSYTIH